MPSNPAHPRDDLPSDLTRMIWTLHRVLRQTQETPEGEHSRPPAQVELLRLVESQPGISVREVAEILRMQANNVSTLVSLLVRDGYLDRRPDPGDRRTVQLHPTEKMRLVSEEISRGLHKGVSHALEQLSPQAYERVAAAMPHLWELTGLLAPPR